MLRLPPGCLVASLNRHCVGWAWAAKPFVWLLVPLLRSSRCGKPVGC